MFKTVLLARPHPFIVGDMIPFLEQDGYKTIKLDKLDDLPAQAGAAAGAIVSLAVTSSIGESAGAVLRRLMMHAPRLPLLFASMLALDQARAGLERIARQAGVPALILGADATPEAAARLGRQETFLYVSKDDLALPERRASALRLVRRHFR